MNEIARGIILVIFPAPLRGPNIGFPHLTSRQYFFLTPVVQGTIFLISSVLHHPINSSLIDFEKQGPWRNLPLFWKTFVGQNWPWIVAKKDHFPTSQSLSSVEGTHCTFFCVLTCCAAFISFSYNMKWAISSTADKDMKVNKTFKVPWPT